MFESQLLNVASYVGLAIIALAIFWFWVGRNMWASRQVWSEIRAYNRFGMRWEDPVLKGTEKGVFVKVLPYESAIDVIMTQEPEMRLNPNLGEDDGIELGDEVHFRFDSDVLDDYFTFRSATVQCRDRLLANQGALDELTNVVQHLGEDVKDLSFYQGIFRLTLDGKVKKAGWSCLHTDQLDTWIPRLVKLVSKFDEIEGLGSKKNPEENEWPS